MRPPHIPEILNEILSSIVWTQMWPVHIAYVEKDPDVNILVSFFQCILDFSLVNTTLHCLFLTQQLAHWSIFKFPGVILGFLAEID